MNEPSNRLLYFFAAVGVVGPIALGASAWWFVRGEPAGPLVAIAGLFVHEGDEAGVAALRAIGCENVFVTTRHEVLGAQATPGAHEDDASPVGRDLPIVSCTSYAGRVPTCEEVASTYVPFLAVQQEALVRVTSRGAGVCNGRYAASGAYLGSTLDYELGRDREAGEP